jgi:hypothetical protein
MMNKLQQVQLMMVGRQDPLASSRRQPAAGAGNDKLPTVANIIYDDERIILLLL